MNDGVINPIGMGELNGSFGVDCTFTLGVEGMGILSFIFFLIIFFLFAQKKIKLFLKKNNFFCKNFEIKKSNRHSCDF